MSFAKARKEAGKRWAAWARALAADGSTPPPLELLEVGALLQVSEPAAALEADAAAITRVQELESRAAALREKVAGEFAAVGGPAAARERLSELRAELRRLESLFRTDWRSMEAGRTAGEAARVRARHPRVFDPPKQARRREAAA